MTTTSSSYSGAFARNPGGGAGSSIVLASGPDAGQAVANPATLGGNGLLTNVVLFNVRLNDLDYLVNDLRVAKDFDVGSGSATFTAGFSAFTAGVSAFSVGFSSCVSSLLLCTCCTNVGDSSYLRDAHASAALT